MRIFAAMKSEARGYVHAFSAIVGVARGSLVDDVFERRGRALAGTTPGARIGGRP